MNARKGFTLAKGSPAVVDFDVEIILGAASAAAEDSDSLTAEQDWIGNILRASIAAMTVPQRRLMLKDSQVRATVEGSGAAWKPPPVKDADDAEEALSTWLIDVAREHGDDSEPDHEVGDLQAFLRSAWLILNLDQRRKVLADEDLQETFDAVLISVEPGLVVSPETLVSISIAPLRDQAQELATQLSLGAAGLDDQQLCDILNMAQFKQVIGEEENADRHTIEPRRRSSRSAMGMAGG